MKTVNLESFSIIGISIRTSNENGQSATDIGALWQKFMSEDILSRIPNKVNHEVYSIYTDYEDDHTKPYTTLLGCKVSSLEEIPQGMVAKSFEKSMYAKFTTKGSLADNIVYDAWSKIWNEDLDRKYIGDFEVYGEKAQDPTNATVDIYVGIE